MLRQPLQRFTQMQATDIDIYRKELRRSKINMVACAFVHSRTHCAAICCRVTAQFCALQHSMQTCTGQG